MRVGVAVGVWLGVSVLVAVAVEVGLGVLVKETGVLELVAGLDCDRFSPGFREAQPAVKAKSTSINNKYRRELGNVCMNHTFKNPRPGI